MNLKTLNFITAAYRYHYTSLILMNSRETIQSVMYTKHKWAFAGVS